jgi:hypothetical protein
MLAFTEAPQVMGVAFGVAYGSGGWCECMYGFAVNGKLLSVKK